MTNQINDWAPTHRVHWLAIDLEGEDVMLTEGVAYTKPEWDATASGDLELVDGEWLFQGKPFEGRVVEL